MRNLGWPGSRLVEVRGTTGVLGEGHFSIPGGVFTARTEWMSSPDVVLQWREGSTLVSLAGENISEAKLLEIAQTLRVATAGDWYDLHLIAEAQRQPITGVRVFTEPDITTDQWEQLDDVLRAWPDISVVSSPVVGAFFVDLRGADECNLVETIDDLPGIQGILRPPTTAC